MGSRQISASDVQDQFRAAMRAAGLVFDDAIVADGQLQRFRVDGDKSGQRNGWYVLHADELPAGAFGCWKRGIDEKWQADTGRTLTDEERAAARERFDAIKRQRDEDLSARRAAARKKAAGLWDKAAPRPKAKHPYLVAKSVRAYGIRQLGDALVIPVRDTAGQLHGLQFVQPDGSKRFTTGMAKAGHYHGIGKPRDVLLIVEGYATGATLHEATGHAVAVAFDAGNLRSVAEALRAKFPGARIVVAADNDHRTDGNPGLSKAREAAQAVAGVVLAPEFDADATGSDWNDWAAVHGLDAVRSTFETLPEPGADAEAAPAQAAAPAKAKRSSKAISDVPARQPRFTRDERGVWLHAIDPKDGTQLPPYWVCPPLEVAAYLRDINAENWGRLLVFKDKDHVDHRWGMPMRLLSGGCDEMRAELLRLGFDVPANPKSRNLLTDYIQQSRPEARARCVERAGWHGRVFVMPERTIGDGDEPVLFQTETTGGHVYREHGTLDAWRSDLADLCRGNSRLLFAVSAAFAGPLLHWAGEDSGGFHLRGTSSSGKTTALRVAASVWGGASFMRRWRATDNAIESIAAQYSDGLLILDELGQIDPRIAGEAAYMLGNGEGKARAQRGGGSRPVLTWRLLFLSAGELSLAEHMRQGGKQAQAGQETRLADIPADAGAGLGMFETLHSYASGAAFSRAISEAAGDSYGLAGPAFLRALLPQLDTLPDTLRDLRKAFLARHVPAGADGQVQRVASRIALVAAGGELATQAGITGWEAGDADAACARCLNAWIDTRGGTGNLEPLRMLSQVRKFLELHGSARFQKWDDDPMSKDWITVNRAGYRKASFGDELNTFFVLGEVFEHEICAGLDHRQVARVLDSVGALKRPNGEKQYKRKERLPGFGSTRCYVILPAIWEAVPTADDHHA